MGDMQAAIGLTECESALAVWLGVNLFRRAFLRLFGEESQAESLAAWREFITPAFPVLASLRKGRPGMWLVIKETAREGFGVAATGVAEEYCGDGDESCGESQWIAAMLADTDEFDAVWAGFSDKMAALMKRWEKQPGKTPTDVQ
jgi:hypothetical protein